MKRNLVLILTLVLSIVFVTAGCDQIKRILGPGAPGPADSGPGGLTPGTTPGQPGPGSDMTMPGIYPQRQLECCTITDFKAGIITEGPDGDITVRETFDIQYIPSTYLGIYFNYNSKTGKPIQYREEEFFPYPPQDWSIWEGIDGSYRTFPEENRAVYMTVLTPVSDKLVSTWGFNPSGDPIGIWRWDIYFDDEYYTSVVFNIIRATY